MIRQLFPITVLVACGAALADPPTAPATQSDSVADQVRQWEDDFENETPEHILRAYAIHDESQRELARVFAAEGVADSRLIKLARQRWGAEGEMAVAHATGTDCRADDARANIVYVGNHATMSFNAGAINPFLLVREQGRWLIDTPSYLRLAGDLPEALKEEERYTAIENAAADSLSKGNYPSADALVADVKKQLDQAGQ